VIVPVFIHDTLWGFIGFFNATEQERSVDEIEALRITANLLGAAMGYR
jgi:GAF domain-containing protein